MNSLAALTHTHTRTHTCDTFLPPPPHPTPPPDPSPFIPRYGKVRIFKIVNVSNKSKKWIADPANRDCDAPGSWYCTGNYPPALDKVISKRKNFKQLEDFNKEADGDDEKYQEEYHKRMSGEKKSSKKALPDGEGGGDAKAQAKAAAKAAEDERKAREEYRIKPPLAYVGCYGGEAELGADKEYGGGGTGANMRLALQVAQEKGAKYLAVARVEQDGHSFFFSEPPTDNTMGDDSGCARPCLDDDAHRCGCSDGGCGDIAVAEGEEHLRRWVVYAVPEKVAKKSKKKGKKKKKKKKKKAQQDEL
jgi:dolichyl-diphosphooligosaccharide--protein glycosyltransferase